MTISYWTNRIFQSSLRLEQRRALGRELLAIVLLCLSFAPRYTRGADREQRIDHQIDVDQLLRKAHVAAQEQRFAEAKTLADLVIKETPHYLDAYMLLARLAAWQNDFETALAHNDSIFVQEPQYRPALLLKLEIYIWAEMSDEAEALIDEFLAAGYESAYFYYRLAQVETQRLQHLKAYAHARKSLKLDPFHKPSRDLADATRFATVFVNHDFEYYDFPEESASTSKIQSIGEQVSLVDPALRFGYSLSVTAQAWSRSILSFSLINTSIYRYKTINNRVGFELIYRATKNLDFTFRTFWGSPARVIPKTSFFLGAYARLAPWMDSTLSLAIDILPWPSEEPAVVSSPALNVGFFIKQFARIDATYKLGVMSYCDQNELMHSFQIGGELTIKNFSIKCRYGYGEENDKSDTSLVAPGTCASFKILKDIGYENTMFGLIGIYIHTFGIELGWQVLEKLRLRLGYHPQFRLAESNNVVLPAHIISLGGSYWF